MMDDCSIELVLKITSLFPSVYQAAVKQITEEVLFSAFLRISVILV